MATPSSSSRATAQAAAAPSLSAISPCAGCKFLRRKCQPDCVFAPYFPPDQPHRFAHVHKVFGASNVAKLLHELTPYQRGDAASSLAYEAEMRLRDPVYGCVGVISVLQRQLRQLQMDLSRARSELSRYHQASSLSGDGGGASWAGHGLIDVSMDDQVGIGELGMQKEPFLAPAAREHHHYHLHHHEMLMRSTHEAEMAAGGAGEDGACDAGFMAAGVNVAAGLGPLGGIQFMQPSAAADGEERKAFGPS